MLIINFDNHSIILEKSWINKHEIILNMIYDKLIFKSFKCNYHDNIFNQTMQIRRLKILKSKRSWNVFNWRRDAILSQKNNVEHITAINFRYIILFRFKIKFLFFTIENKLNAFDSKCFEYFIHSKIDYDDESFVIESNHSKIDITTITKIVKNKNSKSLRNCDSNFVKQFDHRNSNDHEKNQFQSFYNSINDKSHSIKKYLLKSLDANDRSRNILINEITVEILFINWKYWNKSTFKWENASNSFQSITKMTFWCEISYSCFASCTSISNHIWFSLI